MLEIFEVIIEVFRNFGLIFPFLGIVCALIAGVGSYSAMRARWRNRRHYANDYSGYLWPGEGRTERYVRSFFGTVGYLMAIAASFTVTFTAATIAAGVMALALFGRSWLLCGIVFLPALAISGIAGAFGQYLSDLLESSLLDYAESMAGICRPRFRRTISGRTQFSR